MATGRPGNPSSHGRCGDGTFDLVGSISFGLVTIPVKACSAIPEHDVHFQRVAEKRTKQRATNRATERAARRAS